MLLHPRLRRCISFGVAGTLVLSSVLPVAPAFAMWDSPPDVYAITNARIVPVNGKTLEKGTIVFRDGIILSVGESVEVPADAQVIDGNGLTVYPAMVDAYTRVGMPAPDDYSAASRGDGYPVATVRSENTASGLLRPDAAGASALQRIGFGAALSAPYVGLFSGTSAVVSLGDNTTSASMVIQAPVGMHLSFNAAEIVGGYPGALMGQIAVTRQAMYDALSAADRLEAYNKNPQGKPRPTVPRAVSALIPVVEKKMPLIVQASSKSDMKRVLHLSKEFGVKPVIEGGTQAYAVVEDLKKADVSVLLSANLPGAPRTAPGEEDTSTLQALRLRALAPTSASALAKAGVPFALTTSGMDTLTDFNRNVRRIIAAGLTEEQALVATTLSPAKILGVDRQLGSLETGKIANVLAVEGGTLFSGKARIKHLFVDGKKVDVEAPATPAGGGRGGSNPAAANIASSLPPGVTPQQAVEFLRQNPNAARQFLPPGVTVEQAIEALQGGSGGQGGGAAAGGAARQEEVTAPPPVGTELIPPLPPALPSSFVLRGGTVWTSGPQGKLENADVYVKDGKISAVGAGLKVPDGTKEIDAKGRHITPGIIDCHSHTAIDGGVNEGTNIVTAECRIEDVLDPEDVNIYRQLAGGTTAANVLHGSANAIGGQNAIVKWRWGAEAEGLLLEGAPKGIKFALGENPTRSNGGIPSSGVRRYPATRMGVERVIRAKFVEAQDYKKQMAAYKQGKIPVPPRRDLQLDAIVEILDGKRLVHCHSYRGDEILAMTRLAEEFGFRIATFQHVLEGYKVADEMAKHGVGGSTFSDWWGYKIEAYDAIPYNGSLMAERGVVVSFNSDSDELARRLNLEAAKAVRYGGMKPEEALKLVTINPAKQLGVDKSVGSLEPGKDADIAVWSGSPLSNLSVCDMTFVDGKLYFDRAADLAARPELENEKKRLQAALNPPARRPGGPGAPGATPDGAPPANPPATPPTTLDAPPNVVARGPQPFANPKAGPVTAIVGATIHPISSADIPGGVVLMQDGKILSVGATGSISVPADAQKVDANGLHIYPGLIDADTTLGVNEIGSRRETQDFSELGDFKPELHVEMTIDPDSETIRVARTAGVLNAVTTPSSGTISGMGALLQLDGWSYEEFAIGPSVGLYLNFPTLGARRFRETAHHCEETAGSADEIMENDPAFRSGAFVPALSTDREAVRYGQPPAQPSAAPGQGRRGQGRPGGFGPGAGGPPSADTVLKPLNEFLADARRYRTAKLAEGKGGVPPLTRDICLEGMIPVLDGKVPLFVRANRERDIRGAVAWAKKEGLKMVLIGGLEADKAADVLVKENVPVILGPVMELPSAFDKPYDDAYTLPSRVAKAGVKFCLSTGNAQDVRWLPLHAAMAGAYGLGADEALKAITLYPAQILGAGSRLGSIEPGKDANLLITTGNPLEVTSEIKSAYIAGQSIDLSNRQTHLYEHWRSRPKPATK